MRRFVIQSIILAAIIAACVLLCQPVKAGTLAESVGLAGGVNAVWLDGPGSAFPADVEACGAGKASLSPHLSAVASLSYGFSHSYLRWDGGFRATATDVDNPNFNVYLGIRYRGGSTTAVQPSEWAPDAGFGWKPSPERFPQVIVVGDAGYGMTSARTLAYLGVRYVLPQTLFR